MTESRSSDTSKRGGALPATNGSGPRSMLTPPASRRRRLKSTNTPYAEPDAEDAAHGGGVGVRVDVFVGVAVRVDVWLGVAVEVCVAVAVVDGVSVAVAVDVGVPVGVSLGLGVSVSVGVAVFGSVW